MLVAESRLWIWVPVLGEYEGRLGPYDFEKEIKATDNPSIPLLKKKKERNTRPETSLLRTFSIRPVSPVEFHKAVDKQISTKNDNIHRLCRDLKEQIFFLFY
jgi:hypothetical protein